MSSKLAALSLLSIGLWLSVPAVFASTDCDARFVEEQDTRVIVHPSAPSQLDAINLQCAFDLAVQRGKTQVRLTKGTYSIRSRIEVSSYAGSFTGETIATTVIKGCSGSSGGIFFRGGSPTVTRMTFDSTAGNCDSQITVTNVSDTCGDSSTVFVRLDRLLLKSSRYVDQAGIVIAPSESCSRTARPDTKLLGKVLINRVEMRGEFYTGARLAMAGGAQIDVFFSYLVGRDHAVHLLNPGTNTQVVSSNIEASSGVRSRALLIEYRNGVRRSSNVLSVTGSTITGLGGGIYQGCSDKCFVTISDSTVTSNYGSPIETERKGVFRVFDSSIYGKESILLFDNSVISNNDIDIFAIPDIRLRAGGNTINQPQNDVFAPTGSVNLISSRN